MRLRKHLALLVVAVLVGSVPGAVEASLYGVSMDTDSLYTVDPSTGAATFIGPLGAGLDASFSGAAFLAGQLFVTDVFISGVGGSFGTVDITTGAYTPINDQGGSNNWIGLAADQNAGLLYTINWDDGSILKSVTPGGTITSIGTGTGVYGAGMAYDNANDILYAVDYYSTNLYSIDTTTGTSALIGSLGFGNRDAVGLDYDDDADILYATVQNSLYTVDVTTGAATLIGQNGVSRIDALAWLGDGNVVIPEPATLSLLALGGLALLRRRPRR